MGLEDTFKRKEIFYGPMASGKTFEFIGCIKKFEHIAKKFNYTMVIFQPELNRRDAQGVVQEAPLEVLSRTGLTYCGHVVRVRNSYDILQYFLKTRKPNQKTLAGITEVQFLDSNTIDVVEKLSQRDCLVIMEGIDLSFRGEPCPFVQDYRLTMADLIASVPPEGRHQLTAYCDACGDVATHTQRVLNGQPAPYYDPILQQGYGYEARCKIHFEIPGKEEYNFVRFTLHQNSGITPDDLIDLVRTAGKIEPDVARKIIATLSEEKIARKESDGKLYMPPEIIIPPTTISIVKS